MQKTRLWSALFAMFVAMSSGAQTTVTTSGGTTNSIPMFSGNTTLQNSTVSQTLSGSSVVTSINNATRSAGFQFLSDAQLVGGSFGEGGSLTFQANSVTDTAATGGNIFIGGSARGDALLGKVFLSGSYVPGATVQTAGVLVNSANNVGVGINPYTDPAARLEVSGAIKIDGGAATANGLTAITFPDNSVQTVAWNGTLSGGDYAESVDVTGDRAKYESGDVLVIDSSSEGQFLKSEVAYSTSVTGVYSTNPGVVGRRQKTAKSHMKDEVPMAMTGIVPVKVTAENGPIKPGDLLVTSSRVGYAMKGTDRTQMLGAVLGKALEHLDEGTGVIEVVVTLQ